MSTPVGGATGEAAANMAAAAWFSVHLAGARLEVPTGGDASARAQTLVRTTLARAATDVSGPADRWRAVAAAVFDTTPACLQPTLLDAGMRIVEELRAMAPDDPYEPQPESLPSSPAWWTSPQYPTFLLEHLRSHVALHDVIARLPAVYRTVLAADQDLVAGLLDGASPPALRLVVQTALVPVMPVVPPEPTAPGDVPARAPGLAATVAPVLTAPAARRAGR